MKEPKNRGRRKAILAFGFGHGRFKIPLGHTGGDSQQVARHSSKVKI